MLQAYTKHPYANSGLAAAVVCGVLVWVFASPADKTAPASGQSKEQQLTKSAKR